MRRLFRQALYKTFGRDRFIISCDQKFVRKMSSHTKFILLFFTLAISCVRADISEIVQRPRFSLKTGIRDPKTFNLAFTRSSSETNDEEQDADAFPRGFQLPHEHVRESFRPFDPHRTPIYHRPTMQQQIQIVDQEEQIPTHEGYHYPKPSQPFPEDSRPFEPTTVRPEFIPSTESETEVDKNFLHVQGLHNPTDWRPEGFFVFELPSPSHHQSVVYYTLPRLSNVQGANFRQPVKGQHFVPKVFYLPPDYYHQGEGQRDFSQTVFQSHKF